MAITIRDSDQVGKKWLIITGGSARKKTYLLDDDEVSTIIISQAKTELEKGEKK
jgi:hypothetical protein